MVPKDPRSLLQVIAKLEHLRSAGQAKGLRQFNRWIVRGEAEIQGVDEQVSGPPLRIHIRDISWGGVGFICDRALFPKTLWRMHILFREQIVGHQSMIVRHCRKVDEDVYLVGGQFVIDAGLMCILGVDPAAMREGDQTEVAAPFSFQAPSEVA